jgi:hypothetical protein
MNPQSASTRQLVDEFKRRVVQAAPQPEDPLAALCAKNLRDLKPFGSELLNTLEAALESFIQAPKEEAPSKSLEAALVAVYRFGLAWEDSLIRNRAIELLQLCEEGCHTADDHNLLRVSRLALYQLSLKLNSDQVADIALDAPRITPDADAVEYHRQLDLAVPRHLLIESEHVLDVVEEAAGSVLVGGACSKLLKSHLAGQPHEDLLSFRDLHHLSQSLVNSFVLLIPSLRRNLDELDLQMNIPAADIIDNLSWVARAAVFERDHKQYATPRERAKARATDPDECALHSMKDLAWVGLAVLLDPKCSWADEVGYERKQMIEHARRVLHDDKQLNRNYSNRVGLTFFLSAVDQSPLAKNNWQQCLSKLVATLRNMAPASRDLPPPGDCLAAAMAWWLRTPHEDALWGLQPPASPSILKQAFWGRITHPLVQSYLYRALQEQLR